MSVWRVPIFLSAFLLFASTLEPGDLFGQRPLQVQPLRDLNFGDLLAGVPRSISRLDPTNSGRFEVRGQPNAEIVFTFTLPPALVSGGGETLTLEFGPDDGGFSRNQNQASSVGFDPRVPYMNRDPNGRMFLWLGGTARPAPTQSAGLYQATVILTVAYTGN